MRSSIVVCTGFTLAACGGGSGSATIPVPSAPVTVEVSTSLPTTTATPDTTSPPSRPTNSTTDQAAPEPGSTYGSAKLDIEQALLPDHAFASPWEPQFREVDRTGYGAGPNQTDCAPYWFLEELRGTGGGHAMWWVDGGNANHYVARIAHPSDIADLFELVSIPKMCPTVHWSEGGSFTTELIELDDAIGLRFIDVESGDVTWFAVVTFGDLVSVLDVPLWTNGVGEAVAFGRDDLNRLATEMHTLLRAAGPLDPNLAPSATVPGTADPNTSPTTNPNTPQTTNPNTSSTIQTTAPSTARPTDAPVTGIGKLLLGRGDLPSGYGSPTVRAHVTSGPEDELVESCPAAVSIDRIDAILEWGATFSNEDGVEVEQMIGRASSASDAIDLVELFARTAECDLSASFGAEIETSGGMVVVEGADAAASLLLGSPDEYFAGELVVVAVDDVVVVISTSSDAGGPLDPLVADTLAELAVAKVSKGLR